MVSLLSRTPFECRAVRTVFVYQSLVLIYCSICWAQPVTQPSEPTEADYYRIITVASSQAATDSRSENWQPSPDGVALEVSGIAVLDNERIAVAIRKGEVWLIDGAYADPPKSLRYQRFANALHEPLGLLKLGDSLYCAQRSELTQLRDTTGDDVADEYLTVASGWGVTGHYHEYAYGPKVDGEGNLWITLNIGMGLNSEQLKRVVAKPAFGYKQGLWRGWAMRVNKEPMAAGMRSPSGLGANARGDMFYTDQQGNWVATNSLHHLRRGAFYHHAEALASTQQPASPLSDITEVPDGLPYPEAIQRMPSLVPPAVWFPYKKMGQSATDIMLDSSGGKFGPFDGQLFVGEFTQAGIHRVFLETVDGQYQGACFPFRSGFDSAVLRLAQGTDGSLFVGLTNRGWSSLGVASYGLQRLVWSGRTPFEIKEMRATSTGFELHFTKPVDRRSASDVASYAMHNYTYLYHETYGSDEIQNRQNSITAAEVSGDGLSVRLTVAGLRKLYVHELTATGIRDCNGLPLLHPAAYYTLNKIPGGAF
jgi:glucose/arabinose dehydrogenase